MRQLFVDPHFPKDLPRVFDLLSQSKFSKRVQLLSKQRIRKDDILIVSSHSSKVEELNKKFSYALSFQIDGFNFQDQNSFDYHIDLPINLELVELEGLLTLIFADELNKFKRKIKRGLKNSLKELNGKFELDGKVSNPFKKKTGVLESAWLDCRHKQDFHEKTKNSLKNLMPNRLSILEVGEITNESFKTQSFLYFGSDNYFLSFSKEGLNKQERNQILFIFDLICRYYHSLQKFLDHNNPRDQIRERFRLMENPVAVCNKEGNLLVYNPLFLNLNLTASGLKNLVDGQMIKARDKVYDIEVKSSGGIIFYHFKESESLQTKVNDQDLGIITSSIAHELNNPLAAIIAALQVLLLDELGEETDSTLREMERGAKRCQKLVETFLGFSRSRGKSQKENFRQIVKQAYELVRFREIENNLKVTWQVGEELSQQEFQASTMIMSMYLILNNILLSYQRNSLINNSKVDQVDLSIEQYEQGIGIKCFPEINFHEEFLSSKLLEFLLREEGFKLQLSPSEIFFSHM